MCINRIPHQDCETSYIGETKRSLQKRIIEHKYAVKNNDRKKWDTDQTGKQQKYWRLNHSMDQKHTACMQPSVWYGY